ncbi:MAG: extracellular solute-binding protein [Gammaproteobacteria bacterium]|nr:extracellular solute-binding protein [Gammaproteobacteria bacterium]
MPLNSGTPQPGLGLLVALFACASNAGFLEELEFKHGIAFFDDLKYSADFTHFEYLNPDAPKGGKLVLSHGYSFDTLAPSPQGETGAPSGYLYRGETLVVRSGDEVTAFYGRLADGIAVADDERTIVFRIHPDARWDDGVPITAGDVVFTFDRQRSGVGSGLFFRFIVSVDALDERHVAFRLDAPLTHDHVTLIQYIPILPAHYWREGDPAAHTLVPPVSSGPYRVKDLQPGRYIEYERNPHYWGWHLPLNQGRYNFDTVRYDVYRDYSVAREAFRKGLIDILDEDDIRYWVTAYEGPDLDSGRIQKIRRKYGIWVGIGRAFVLNSRVPRLADGRVREALTLTLDYEWIKDKFYHGERVRAGSYWPGTILSATGSPSADETALLSPFRDSLPSALFERPFQLPVGGSRTVSNLIEARELFAAAGWHIEAGLLRDGGGEPFTLEFLSADPADARILLPWFQALERLGIEANIRLLDITQYTSRVRRHDYEALVQSNDFLMPPTLELRANFHSSAATQEGSRNYTGVSHPAVDFLVETAEAAETLDEMIAACRALDRVMLWGHHLIPLYAYDSRRTVFWDKFGRPPEPRYRPAYPDGWWYDEAKAARLTMDR